MGLKIIGAGTAGLLAANMLRKYDPVVVEAQPSLPHNHSAVLRFRSRVVADTLGMDFKKVSVIKYSLPWRNPVADSLCYSFKNIGSSRSDRSIPTSVEAVERYVAPPDLVSRMAEDVRIIFGTRYDFSQPDPDGDAVISTVPMQVLMSALHYRPQPEFLFIPGVNIRAKVFFCDAYVSVYVPDPSFDFSRVSITGDELIVELPGAQSAKNVFSPKQKALAAAELLGIEASRVSDVTTHDQRYSKIVPIDEHVRREFIHYASTQMRRAFSLGRYATWRPGLLMDDLVKDVKQIERLMRSRSMGYDAERMERERA